MNNPFPALVAQTADAAPLCDGKKPRAIYRHVTPAERVRILELHAEGMSMRAIGAALDRPKITVSRVIRAARQGGQL